MVKIKLIYPVEYDGTKYSELEVRRPKMKHLKKMPADPTVDDLMALSVKLTDLPVKVIEELDAKDGMALLGVIGGFLSGGQETGEI
jgi:hypothetical protein